MNSNNQYQTDKCPCACHQQNTFYLCRKFCSMCGNGTGVIQTEDVNKTSKNVDNAANMSTKTYTNSYIPKQDEPKSMHTNDTQQPQGVTENQDSDINDKLDEILETYLVDLDEDTNHADTHAKAQILQLINEAIREAQHKMWNEIDDDLDVIVGKYMEEIYYRYIETPDLTNRGKA